MSNIKKLPLTDVQFAYMFGRNSSIILEESLPIFMLNLIQSLIQRDLKKH